MDMLQTWTGEEDAIIPFHWVGTHFDASIIRTADESNFVGTVDMQTSDTARMANQRNDLIGTGHVPARNGRVRWLLSTSGFYSHFDRSICTTTDDRVTIELNARHS